MNEEILDISLNNLIKQLITNPKSMEYYYNIHTDLFDNTPILKELKFLYKNNIKIYNIQKESYSILSNTKIPDNFTIRISDFILTIKNWLIRILSYKDKDFPFILIYIDKNNSQAPKTILYQDKRIAKISLSTFNITKEKIIHELMHALSFINDNFSSELLACFSEVSGLFYYDTIFKKFEKKYNITVEEILKYNSTDLCDIYNIFFGNINKITEQEKYHYYLKITFYYIFNFLCIRTNKKIFIKYFKEIDFFRNNADKLLFFEEIFNIDLKKIMYLIKNELKMNYEKNISKNKKTEKINSIYKENLNNDIINLIFIKTFIKKYSEKKESEYELKLLSLDFKIYMANKKQGITNINILRKLMRKNKKIIDSNKAYLNFWILRYHILTEYLNTIYEIDKEEKDFKNINEEKIHIDKKHIEELKTILNVTKNLDKNNIETKIIHGQFNSFYPEYLNTNRKKGLKLLKEAVQMDNDRSEIYNLIIQYYLKNNTTQLADEWLEKYKNNFKDDTNLIHHTFN